MSLKENLGKLNRLNTYVNRLNMYLYYQHDKVSNHINYWISQFPGNVLPTSDDLTKDEMIESIIEHTRQKCEQLQNASTDLVRFVYSSSLSDLENVRNHVAREAGRRQPHQFTIRHNFENGSSWNIHKMNWSIFEICVLKSSRVFSIPISVERNWSNSTYPKVYAISITGKRICEKFRLVYHIVCYTMYFVKKSLFHIECGNGTIKRRKEAV